MSGASEPIKRTSERRSNHWTMGGGEFVLPVPAHCCKSAGWLALQGAWIVEEECGRSIEISVVCLTEDLVVSQVTVAQCSRLEVM